MGYLYLLVAIVAEVIATLALRASEEFTRPVPVLVLVLGYGVAFYFLTLTFRTLPVGITYAIWSGIGITLITIASAFMFRQVPDLPAIVGMAMIVGGVAVIHLFSKTVAH